MAKDQQTLGSPRARSTARSIPPLVTGRCTDQASESKDRIGFGLSGLVLCLLPIQRLMLPFGLTIADAILILLTLYTLGRVWHTRQRLDFPLLLPMWLIMFSSSIATLVGFAHFNSIVAIIQEIYIFAWFIALVNILKTLPLSDLDLLMKIWSVVACVESITTVMGMLRIGPSMFYTKPHHEAAVTTEIVRAVGTYVNSNAAAVYLSVSFFIVLATSWPIGLRLGLAVWIFIGMFGTGSNGALFSTLGSLVILVVVYSTIKNRHDIKLLGAIIGIGAGIIAVVLLILSLSPSLLPRLGLDTGAPMLFQTLGRMSHSLLSRLDIIGWAWKTYIRHPLGTGPNSFASLGGSLHNDYAAFWFERGPLGIIGWLWMVGATLLMPLQVSSQLTNQNQRWQVLTLGAGFLACAINAFSHEVSHMRQVWMLMVFLFASGYAILAQQARRAPGSINYTVKKSV